MRKFARRAGQCCEIPNSAAPDPPAPALQRAQKSRTKGASHTEFNERPEAPPRQLIPAARLCRAMAFAHRHRRTDEGKVRWAGERKARTPSENERERRRRISPGAHKTAQSCRGAGWLRCARPLAAGAGNVGAAAAATQRHSRLPAPFAQICALFSLSHKPGARSCTRESRALDAADVLAF